MKQSKVTNDYEKYLIEKHAHEFRTYKDLTNEELIHIATLRLGNKLIFKDKVTCVTMLDYLGDGFVIKVKKKYKSSPFCVDFLVSSKNFATYQWSMVFDMFYPNEFLYLEEQGINF